MRQYSATSNTAMRYSKLAPNLTDAIVAAHRAGESKNAISKRLGVAYKTVHRICGVMSGE